MTPQTEQRIMAALEQLAFDVGSYECGDSECADIGALVEDALRAIKAALGQDEAVAVMTALSSEARELARRIRQLDADMTRHAINTYRSGKLRNYRASPVPLFATVSMDEWERLARYFDAMAAHMEGGAS